METSSKRLAPLIYRLTIERFRGIEKLVWFPKPGLNVILGGGDVGKSTVLDAIALLFSPSNTTVLSDADYWQREVDKEFCIEAVMSLPESCGMNRQTKQAWPWEWNGNEPILPNTDDETTSGNITEPVYRLRVRGTSEFDVAFEVHQPDDSFDHFGVAVRRSIGLVRLSGDDRNDRDLRLVQGSALDRLVSDKTLRSRLGQKLAESDVEDALKDESKTKIVTLDEAFKKQGLPTGLGVGLTGGQGLSLNALIGLTAKAHPDVTLPLANWGAGTRRLAALEIAAAHQENHPITVVDEVERGLEPYRQRVLMAKLQSAGSQVFLTTHSAAALTAASDATIWYMDFNGTIGSVPESVAVFRKRDPETLLARLAIITEGPTEEGFVSVLLERAIGNDLLERGVWITNAGGNDGTLTLLEDLSKSGIKFGGFADDEGRFPTRWDSVRSKLGNLLFRWATGCLEENIIKHVPLDRLEEFICDADGDSGVRRRTLADRLGIVSKEFSAISTGTTDLKKLIIEAASGSWPPDREEASKGEAKTWKKHGQDWFKSVAGGRELASKVSTLNLWPQINADLLPFVNAVRSAVSLPAISALPV